jgi:creatinine amidohydrolase
MKILREIFLSLFKHGIKKLIIINGHDGNIPAIDAATREFRTEKPEMKIAVLESWWVTAGELVPEGTFEVWNGLGHGGEGETSIMLAIAPDLVELDKAKGIVPNLPEYIEIKWLFNELSPFAVTGDPTRATMEKGRLMNEVLVNHLVDFIEKMDQIGWDIKDLN